MLSQVRERGDYLMRSLLWLGVASLGVDHLNGGEPNPSRSIEIRDLIINEQSAVQVQPAEGMVEYLGVRLGATNLIEAPHLFGSTQRVGGVCRPISRCAAGNYTLAVFLKVSMAAKIRNRSDSTKIASGPSGATPSYGVS